jgi:hypothetical protein
MNVEGSLLFNIAVMVLHPDHESDCIDAGSSGPGTRRQPSLAVVRTVVSAAFKRSLIDCRLDRVLAAGKRSGLDSEAGSRAQKKRLLSEQPLFVKRYWH